MHACVSKASKGWINADECYVPVNRRGVKVRVVPYKAAGPPGWTLPGTLRCVGEVGGVLGRQTVPACRQSSIHATHAELANQHINQTGNWLNREMVF